MAVCKCSQCGATLPVKENMKVVECEYCGTVQTLIDVGLAQKQKELLESAQTALRNGFFDVAKTQFTSVLEDNATNEEAVLGMVLTSYKLKDRKAFLEYYATHDCSDNVYVSRLEECATEETRQLLASIKKQFSEKADDIKNKFLDFKKYENKVAVGSTHILVIQDDKVKFSGSNERNQGNVGGWENVLQVAAQGFLSVGLMKDGTVKYTGASAMNGADFSLLKYWKDIKYISTGINHIVGIRNNGKPAAAGLNNAGQCDVLPWNGIVDIAAGYDFTVGLKSDGTVVFTGQAQDGLEEVSQWKDIVAIAAGNTHIVGLKSDGTVIGKGRNDFGECSLENWTNIVSIAASQKHTVGLKSDGTVVMAGQNITGKYDISTWRDIVAVAIGTKPAGIGNIISCVVGLKKDGSILIAGDSLN